MNNSQTQGKNILCFTTPYLVSFRRVHNDSDYILVSGPKTLFPEEEEGRRGLLYMYEYPSNV